MLKYLRLLLLPLNLVYALVIFVRNQLYDWGIFKSTSFDMPVICIGNLAVGGSGKTPTTEYLVRLLQNYKVAILSRGYGRVTKGFILADEHASAQTIGDEPLQYYRKFKNVTVAVCEDRVTGINQLKDAHEVILLDDAYQHRKVKAGFNILLFEFDKLRGWQMLLPAGNLRETFSGIKRAQTVIITKSPPVVEQYLRQGFLKKLKLTANQNLAFSHIGYQNLQSLYSQEQLALQKNQVVFLITGIANPLPLRQYLATKEVILHHFEYSDHHRFTEQEIKALVKAFEEHPAGEKIIVTTEKDGQRLLDAKLKDLLLNLPVYYLPINIEINAAERAKFDQKILDYVASAK
ncbi:tetraacyldisaccharide 4'-kinase [Nubsella zeaxanthinifaciens]|uniref:tetraacyldisaccharide 4'-kinase n=1 Tax=Nubsella zeaxanthinifaciens TaxID=392412 RepID=UPI000DE1F848|nr:tetraacyldisaccharide 4'-kinase [Nubsella zeaxanthinifaciens]